MQLLIGPWVLSKFLWLVVPLPIYQHDPTTEVDRPKLKEPTAQNLKPEGVELIYQVAADSNLPKRNIALSQFARATRAKPQLLTEDYGQRLAVRQAKADSIGTVQRKSHLDGYLESRSYR